MWFQTIKILLHGLMRLYKLNKAKNLSIKMSMEMILTTEDKTSDKGHAP